MVAGFGVVVVDRLEVWMEMELNFLVKKVFSASSVR